MILLSAQNLEKTYMERKVLDDVSFFLNEGDKVGIIGINGAAMAHLLEDLDPLYFGAYIDTGHLRAEGEDFATALGMVRPWLSIVSVKDMLVERITKANHGSTKNQWLSAGQGMVDWTYVFDCLRRVGFDGPVSIHCEFHDQGDPFMVRAQREAEFFRPFFQPKPAE